MIERLLQTRNFLHCRLSRRNSKF